MKTLTLLLRRPAECTEQYWQSLAATVARTALDGTSFCVSNTGFSARSIIMLTDDAEPVIVWHVALHPDTDEQETKLLFARAQEDYDLLKLSCTDKEAAKKQSLKSLLSSILSKA